MIVADSCEWSNPGAAPYTGSREAAIYAMAPLPPEARRRLAERAPGSYDYVLTVDRDSVRGVGAEFEREVSWMNFGTGAKVCADVRRTTWSIEHAETAIVYCDAISGYCIGKFSVCNNWAIFTRRPAVALPPSAALPQEFLPAGLPAVAAPAGAAMDQSGALTPATFEGSAGGYAVVGGFGGDSGGGGCVHCPPPPDCLPVAIPPVPEPSIWAAMVLGLLALAFLKSKKTT